MASWLLLCRRGCSHGQRPVAESDLVQSPSGCSTTPMTPQSLLQRARGTNLPCLLACFIIPRAVRAEWLLLSRTNLDIALATTEDRAVEGGKIKFTRRALQNASVVEHFVGCRPYGPIPGTEHTSRAYEEWLVG